MAYLLPKEPYNPHFSEGEMVRIRRQSTRAVPYFSPDEKLEVTKTKTRSILFSIDVNGETVRQPRREEVQFLYFGKSQYPKESFLSSFFEKT